jgi:hypothetical protein
MQPPGEQTFNCAHAADEATAGAVALDGTAPRAAVEARIRAALDGAAASALADAPESVRLDVMREAVDLELRGELNRAENRASAFVHAGVRHRLEELRRRGERPAR